MEHHYILKDVKKKPRVTTMPPTNKKIKKWSERARENNRRIALKWAGRTEPVKEVIYKPWPINISEEVVRG